MRRVRQAESEENVITKSEKEAMKRILATKVEAPTEIQPPTEELETGDVNLHKVEIIIDGNNDPSRVARLVAEQMRRGFAVYCVDTTAPAKTITFATPDTETQRANLLADQCGVLRDENVSLLAENARLRRQLERMKR
jgi:hypothetical protein